MLNYRKHWFLEDGYRFEQDCFRFVHRSTNNLDVLEVLDDLNGIFKLRINLSENSYSARNCQRVINILDSLGSDDDTILAFKHMEIGKDFIPESRFHLKLMEVAFWSACKNKDFEGASEAVSRMPIGGKGSYPEWLKYLENNPDELIKTYEDKIEEATTYTKYLERMTGQAQFTLYLKDNFNVQQLGVFVRKLEAKLSELNTIQPGTVAESDLPLTRFVSITQDRASLDSEYAYGLTEERNNLKKLLADSFLYKELSKELQKFPCYWPAAELKKTNDAKDLPYHYGRQLWKKKPTDAKEKKLELRRYSPLRP